MAFLSIVCFYLNLSVANDRQIFAFSEIVLSQVFHKRGKLPRPEGAERKQTALMKNAVIIAFSLFDDWFSAMVSGASFGDPRGK